MECGSVASSKRVTFVLPQLPPCIGGMEQQAFLQAKYLSRIMEVTVFSISENNNLFEDENVKFVNHKKYIGPIAKEVNAIYLFLSLIWHGVFFRSGIIYFHQINFLTFLSLFVCYFTRKTLLVKVANSGLDFDLVALFARHPYLRLFKFILKNKLVHYLCLNSQNVTDFSEMGLGCVNTIPFRNGVEIQPFCQSGSVTGCIQYLGRIEPIKNIEYIFQLAPIMTDFKFNIVGSGSMSKEIEKASDKFKNVNFLGYMLQAEVPWDDVEWTILPSVAEGMSNALLESLARGKGIICQRLPANSFIEELSEKVVWIDDRAENTAHKICLLSGKIVKPNEKFMEYSMERVVEDLQKIIIAHSE